MEASRNWRTRSDTSKSRLSRWVRAKSLLIRLARSVPYLNVLRASLLFRKSNFFVKFLGDQRELSGAVWGHNQNQSEVYFSGSSASIGRVFAEKSAVKVVNRISFFSRPVA